MTRKIMVDLDTAADGYSGIPQDARLIFSMLAKQPQFTLSGLLYPIGQSFVPRIRAGGANPPSSVAGVINAISNLREEEKTTEGKSRLKRLYQSLLDLKALFRMGYHVQQVPDWMKTDALWRLHFAKTLSPEDRQMILSKTFFASDVSAARLMGQAIATPFGATKKLIIKDQDAVLFPLLRPLRLPRSVKKVVRYHDAIPLTHADTISFWGDILLHEKIINASKRDSVFVCNSPSSLEDLDHIAPGAGEQAIIIPCAIQKVASPQQRRNISSIITQRISLISVGVSDGTPFSREKETILKNIFAESQTNLRYIISVSSLEPRKNFNTAIAAWERLRIATGKDIKFIMVANKGWKAAQILDAMRPHVAAGNLIHLTQLPPVELQTLYQNAEVCLFPSYAEGFGYAPLESLQMGTPVVVSDIPVFRWTLENAALFADPYDTDAIMEATRRLLKEPENETLRAEHLHNAQSVLEKFSPDTIAAQWGDFFENKLDPLHAKMRAAKH